VLVASPVMKIIMLAAVGVGVVALLLRLNR
jgi:energy-converting hydrogenase Eha subunit C